MSVVPWKGTPLGCDLTGSVGVSTLSLCLSLYPIPVIDVKDPVVQVSCS